MAREGLQGSFELLVTPSGCRVTTLESVVSASLSLCGMQYDWSSETTSVCYGRVRKKTQVTPLTLRPSSAALCVVQARSRVLSSRVVNQRTTWGTRFKVSMVRQVLKHPHDTKIFSNKIQLQSCMRFFNATLPPMLLASVLSNWSRMNHQKEISGQQQRLIS